MGWNHQLFKRVSIWCLVGNMCGIRETNLSKKQKHIPNRTNKPFAIHNGNKKRCQMFVFPSWRVILGMCVKHPRLQQLRQVENLPPPPQELIFQETKWLGKHVCFFFVASIFVGYHMGVSENSGTPKSSILIGFSIINHPFWGTPIFGNTQINTRVFQ